MSDKRDDQGGLGPDESVRGRPSADIEDTEGHAVRGRPLTEDPSAARDTEAQGIRSGHEVRPLAEDPDADDADDTEGHRQSLYSDRDLKRDITPVRW